MQIIMLTIRLAVSRDCQFWYVRNKLTSINANRNQCARSRRPCMRSKVDQKLALKLTPRKEDNMDAIMYAPKVIKIAFLVGLKFLTSIISGTHKTTAISINILE